MSHDDDDLGPLGDLFHEEPCETKVPVSFVIAADTRANGDDDADELESFITARFPPSVVRLRRDNESSSATIPFCHLDVVLTSKQVTAAAVLSGGDLTGFGIFPETTALGQFLVDHRRFLSGRRVVELGCGLALPSFVAAACGAELPVVATDGCADVVGLLSPHAGVLVGQHLLWREEGDSCGGDDAIFSDRPFDLVYGSGIAYNPKRLRALLFTAARLLRHDDAGSSEPKVRRKKQFLIGFQSRAVSFDELLVTAKAMNFEYVPPPSSDSTASGRSTLASRFVDVAHHHLGVLVFDFCPS